jgi:hypothetical protein
MRAQLVDIQTFGEKKTKKAIFLTENYDKVGVLLNDSNLVLLAPLKGKMGDLTLGFAPGQKWDYAVSLVSFKVAA